ncbi:hypothetical protein Tco_1167256 [Tanacetum coccineum]
MISPSYVYIMTLEVDAQEVESFDLGSEDLTLESLEAKSFVMTSEDLSLLSQETKSLDTELELPENHAAKETPSSQRNIVLISCLVVTMLK